LTTKSIPRQRTVVADIALSLDGRVTGPGGEYDGSWVVPRALTWCAVRTADPAAMAGQGGALSPRNCRAVGSLTTGVPESSSKKSGRWCRIGAGVFVAGAKPPTRGGPKVRNRDHEADDHDTLTAMPNQVIAWGQALRPVRHQHAVA
jgi:hypothetical protein